MSAYVDIQRHPTASKHYSNVAPTCLISDEKPMPPPRPEKQFRPPRPCPTPEIKPRIKHGPQDFPRTLSLDLPPHESGSDLSKFLCNMKLPQRIKITESFAVAGSKTALNKDDIILLHFIYDNPTIHAITSKRTNVRLPVHAEQKYEILPLDPRLDDVEYDGTQELMNADPLPTTVRVLEAHCSIRHDEVQEADDIIEIEGFEHDKERGKLLVGKCGTTPIKYSVDLDTCKYSTMLSPNFHSLAELKDQKFPQRVRIPDEQKAFSERNFREEEVFHLNSFVVDKCVVATRLDDCYIYSIPITTPLKFSHDPTTLPEKHILDMLPALYPLVNISWGLVDPTQEALKTSMEATAQPIKQVLDAWFVSEEGKAFASGKAERRLDDLKEQLTVANKEMRRMKADLDSLRSRDSLHKSPSDPSAPMRPPKPKPENKPPEIPQRPPKPFTSGLPPSLPPRPQDGRMASMADESASDSDEYEEVDVVKDPQPKDASSDALKTMKDILMKKEKELQEERKRVEFWKTKCEALERGKMAVPIVPAVYEELPDLPEKQSSTVKEDSHDEDDYLKPIPFEVSPRQLPPKKRSQSAPRSIRNMTVGEVGGFLLQHGMGQYVDVFRKNDVNGALLVELRECHLLDLNMTPYHSSKLIGEVKKARKKVERASSSNS